MSNGKETNMQRVRQCVNRMKVRGCDVTLRNAYGRYGLSNGDESRDISPLLPPRELLMFVLGFEAAHNERHRSAAIKEST